jgi:hypothetical protein
LLCTFLGPYLAIIQPKSRAQALVAIVLYPPLLPRKIKDVYT